MLCACVRTACVRRKLAISAKAHDPDAVPRIEKMDFKSLLNGLERISVLARSKRLQEAVVEIQPAVERLLRNPFVFPVLAVITALNGNP